MKALIMGGFAQQLCDVNYALKCFLIAGANMKSSVDPKSSNGAAVICRMQNTECRTRLQYTRSAEKRLSPTFL